jgi:transglutaminase-like putative cysteine protease
LKIRPIFLAVIWLILSSLVHADGEAAELQTRYSHYSVTYTINDDGSFIENRSWAMTILTDKAVAYGKQHTVSYSTSIQRVDVLEAYTVKADGRRIDAPKSNFQVEENHGNRKDAPVFSDITSLTVVFSDVAVGDTVVFSYTLTATQPMFPHEFSTVENFSRFFAFDDLNIIFDFPESLAVHYAARQMTQTKDASAHGRKTLVWHYENPKPMKDKRKNYSVYDIERYPGVSFSTFNNYQEIVDAYALRARPKAVVTPRIQKLADDVTKDITEPRAIVRSLYDWVATNITYAGNCIGLGAVVPHDTDFIIDNRMGDCKDHATLLQALLAAKNIESTQALINAGSEYQLPKIPVVSMVNHVINYIPRFDLYVDSTSDSTPFGLLPFSDLDKPVLLVDNYRDGTKTPPQPVGANQQRMKTHVRFQPDGSAIGAVEVELTGMLAATARERFRQINREVETDIVKNVFRSYGYLGSGNFKRDDPKELLDTFRYNATFDVKELINVPGPGAFSIQPLFFSELPISHFISGALAEFDEVDKATCSSGRSTEEYVYEFPQGMKILAAPDNVKQETARLSYTATYSLKNNVLTVSRVFDDRTPHNVCSAEELESFKQFAQEVKPNFRAQVVYK